MRLWNICTLATVGGFNCVTVMTTELVTDSMCRWDPSPRTCKCRRPCQPAWRIVGGGAGDVEVLRRGAADGRAVLIPLVTQRSVTSGRSAPRRWSRPQPPGWSY